jgi:hypothetical protein
MIRNAATLNLAREVRELTSRSHSSTERGPFRQHKMLDVLLAMLRALRGRP